MMNRRNFLKGSAAAAAATTVPVTFAFGYVTQYEIFYPIREPRAIRVVKAGSKISQKLHEDDLFNHERDIIGKNFSPALNEVFERDPESCVWMKREQLTARKISVIHYMTKPDDPAVPYKEFRCYTMYGNEFDV